MNVYEQAHQLDRAIKESEEYKQYEAMKEKVAEKPELEKMLKDFAQKQMALQAKQMMGEVPSQEVVQSVQNLYEIVSKDPLAAEYLQCEMRFSMMMQDVFNILGDITNLKMK